MKKYFHYIRYLIRHKYYVGRECFKFGLYWRGIIHDWTKVLPSEFFPYVESFYGPKKEERELYIRREKAVLGYQITKSAEQVQEDFDRAWLLHMRRNKHHFQFWVGIMDRGTQFTVEIPKKYLIELYCDWVGAGLAITGKRDVASYYEKMKECTILHPNSRAFLEELIYNNK
jgi:hypothetical protein